VRTSRAIQQIKANLVVSRARDSIKRIYQSKMPDAFFVSQNCFKPRLKSSPFAALGSLSGFLHPAAVHAIGKFTCHTAYEVLTADGDDHGHEEHDSSTESVKNQS
jgi:hypothetical protein